MRRNRSTLKPHPDAGSPGRPTIPFLVMPAEAGIQIGASYALLTHNWIPAFAGMTE